MGTSKVRARVLDETEIDRMLMAERITLDEHNTLESILRDLHAARMIGFRISRYEPTIPTTDPQAITDRQAMAVSKLGRLQKVLDDTYGIKIRRMIISLLVVDLPISSRFDPVMHSAVQTADKFYLDWNEEN